MATTQNHNEHRRVIYQILCALAVPTVMTGWWFNQAANPYVRYTYPLLAMSLAWVFWQHRRNVLPIQRLERFSYWVITTMLLGTIGYELFGFTSPSSIWLGRLATLYLALVLMNAVAFLTYPTQHALIVSLGVSGVAILLSGIRSVGMMDAEFAQLGEISVLFIGSTLTVYLLSKHKDTAAAAELEAEKMRNLAFEDALTGLPNRRQVDYVLTRQSAIAARHDRPLSLISFDLDHFKTINDAYGHGVGDEVLQAIATCINPELRQGDMLGRWGGEEFLVIAPETDEEAAGVLAERLREAVEVHSYPFDIPVTASFGVITTRTETNIQKLLTNVDEQLYRAKLSGRNRVSQLKQHSSSAEQPKVTPTP